MVELNIAQISRSFWNKDNEIAAVKDLSLHIPSGSFMGIVGKSGCGKTTLLKLIAGLEKPDSGEVTFGGSTGEPPRLGIMFQDPRLLPWLTVEQNLRLAFSAKTRVEGDREIDTILGLMGLREWKQVFPRRLSGGMAQRVALARALCRKPHILLLDEPFASLDAFTRKQLRKEMGEIWKSLHTTVILVTHDIEEAVYLSDEVVQMKNGAVEATIPIELPRPREYRAPEFQNICRIIEEGYDRP